MSNVEKGFVPLTYAEQNGSDRAAFQFDFPEYVDKDRIGINLRTVDRACQIGGISDLQLHGVSGMDTSSEELDVVGMNAKGEAVAGRAKIKKADLSQIQGYGTGPYPLPHQMRSAMAHVHYNLDEMSERITSRSDQSKGVRSAGEWAREIDTATKDTISTLGQMQLLKLLESREIALPLTLDATQILLASIDSDFNFKSPDPADIAGRLLLVNAFLNVVEYAETRIKHGKEAFNMFGFRISLFAGPQFDRAIALKAYTRMKTFVKEIKAKS